MISAHALRFHRDSSTHPTESQRRGTTWIQPVSFLMSSWIVGTRRARLDFTRFVEVGHVQDQDLSRMVRPLVPDQLEGTRTARKADMSRVLGRGQIMCPYILCPYILMTPPLDILLPLDTKPKRT